MKPWLFGLVALATSSHALTGNDIYKDLQDAEGSAGALATTAYVRGFLDANSVYEVFAKRDGFNPVFCLPQGADASQARDVLRQYIAANPSERHYDAGVLAYKALARAWPCRR